MNLKHCLDWLFLTIFFSSYFIKKIKLIQIITIHLYNTNGAIIYGKYLECGYPSNGTIKEFLSQLNPFFFIQLNTAWKKITKIALLCTCEWGARQCSQIAQNCDVITSLSGEVPSHQPTNSHRAAGLCNQITVPVQLIYRYLEHHSLIKAYGI